MEKISYRLVYNRKNSLNDKGMALIQVEAYYKKKKAYFSTHIYVTPEQWDKKQQLIRLHPQSEILNRMLEEFVLSLQWKELENWKRGKLISLELLKQSPMRTQKNSGDSLVQLGRNWVEQSVRKESTKNNLYSTISLLHEFSPDLTFQRITYTFLKDFELFLRNKGFIVNTVAKHLRQLRTILNEAIRKDLLSPEANPFRKYKIRTTTSKHCFLLPDELAKLESLLIHDDHKNLQHTLDAFLFCCYTGLRYSDFTHLTVNNLIKPDGKNTWIVFKSIKTEVEIQIPLYLLFQGKAISILRKYQKNLNDFFVLRPNSTINKELIRIGKLAKIEKHFSFHTARHTNASLLIYEGVPITTVQKLLGHQSIKTTEGYSNVFSTTIVNDLKRCKR